MKKERKKGKGRETLSLGEGVSCGKKIRTDFIVLARLKRALDNQKILDVTRVYCDVTAGEKLVRPSQHWRN